MKYDSCMFHSKFIDIGIGGSKDCRMQWYYQFGRRNAGRFEAK